MLTKFKQFIKEIDARDLIPLAAFVTIIAFVFLPLRTLSDTLFLQCNMLARSFCVFVMGCYVAELFKGRITRKIFKYVCIAAALFCLHIIVIDGVYSLRHTPPLAMLWSPYHYVMSAEVHPFFLCLGIIINHHGDLTHKRLNPFRNYGSIKKDIFLAILALVFILIVMYVICIPTFYEEPAAKMAWAIRYIVRILCLPVWIVMFIYLYRCLTSKWALMVMNKFPLALNFLVALTPLSVIIIVFQSMPPFGIARWFDFLYYPILIFAIVVIVRFLVYQIREKLMKTKEL